MLFAVFFAFWRIMEIITLVSPPFLPRATGAPSLRRARPTGDSGTHAAPAGRSDPRSAFAWQRPRRDTELGASDG